MTVLLLFKMSARQRKAQPQGLDNPPSYEETIKNKPPPQGFVAPGPVPTHGAKTIVKVVQVMEYFPSKYARYFLLTMLSFTGSSSRAWSQPGHHPVSSLSAQNHDLDLQQARLHGLVPQRRPLLHRVLALLLCPLHGGQPPECKAHMSQL